MTPVSAPTLPPRRHGPHVGPVPITPLGVIIAVLLIGAPGVMLYGIAAVKDERQVMFLEAGTVGLTIAFTLWALVSLRAMWRAASTARSGRAMLYAIIGGFAAIGAIGSFATTMVLALLWGS